MPDTQDQIPTWLSWLVRHRREAAYLILVLALGALGLSIWWGIQAFRTEPGTPLLDLFTLTCWAGALTLILAATGTYQLLNEPQQLKELEATRLMVVAVGGASGLVTAVAGAVLAYAWWPDLISWLVPEQGKALWKGAVAVLAQFGGLGLMFVSLQVGRAEERTNPTARRLLYGYNAVLTGLLLLEILAIADTLIYIKLPQPIDFTASSIYSLSPQATDILQKLSQPTKIYMILSPRDILFDEVRTLLVNCREVNPRIEVEELSPQNDEKLRAMAQKFTTLGQFGVLILYGEGDPPDYRFIPREDLFTVSQRRSVRRDANEKEGFRFKGEDALMTQLVALTEGNQRTVIYFTQGNGELDLKDSQERHTEGIGLLSERLKKRSMEVKPLVLSAETTKVPEDASVVVIAGPQRDLPPVALKALREYLNRPGKARGTLLVLLQPPTAEQPQTGLQGFLSELNVDAPPERLLTLFGFPDDPAPTVVDSMMASPETNSNPLVKAFQRSLFQLMDMRPVSPGSSRGGPAGARYRAESLMLAPGAASRRQQLIWAEKNLTDPPTQLAAAVFDQLTQRKRFKISLEPISVAVTVSESDPSDPHAGMMGAPPAKQTPRVVVFGNALFASNRYVRDNARSVAFELVAGSLDWLRGKEPSIGIPPKNRDLFQMPPDSRPGPLVWIPTLLLCTSIVGLGAGVWVVRRR